MSLSSVFQAQNLKFAGVAAITNYALYMIIFRNYSSYFPKGSFIHDYLDPASPGTNTLLTIVSTFLAIYLMQQFNI